MIRALIPTRNPAEAETEPERLKPGSPYSATHSLPTLTRSPWRSARAQPVGAAPAAGRRRPAPVHARYLHATCIAVLVALWWRCGGAVVALWWRCGAAAARRRQRGPRFPTAATSRLAAMSVILADCVARGCLQASCAPRPSRPRWSSRTHISLRPSP